MRTAYCSGVMAMLFAADMFQRIVFFLSVSSGKFSFNMRVIILSDSASPYMEKLRLCPSLSASLRNTRAQNEWKVITHIPSCPVTA